MKQLVSDGSLSPQRHQSFIVAVLNAIKNAASTKASSVNNNKKEVATTNLQQQLSENFDESDSTEMLDSETEPCLMMENVLEDVSMPDSHSHNMVSSTGILLSHQLELPIVAASTTLPAALVENMNREEESIHNLSQAIFNRQKIEQQTSLIMRSA